MISDYVLVFLGGVWMFRVEVLAIIGHCSGFLAFA